MPLKRVARTDRLWWRQETQQSSTKKARSIEMKDLRSLEFFSKLGTEAIKQCHGRHVPHKRPGRKLVFFSKKHRVEDRAYEFVESSDVVWSLETQVQTVTNRWILLQFKHSASIEDINIVQFLQFKHSASTEGINIVRTCGYDGWKLTLCALHVSYLTSGHCDDTLIWSNVRLYVLMWPNMTCYIGYGMNYLKRVWRSTFTHKANVWGWSKPSWCKQIWQYILLPDRFHSFHWAFKCRHLPDDLCW